MVTAAGLLVPFAAALAAAGLLGSIALQIANDRPPMWLPSLDGPAPWNWEPGQREAGTDVHEAYQPQMWTRPSARPMRPMLSVAA